MICLTQWSSSHHCTCQYHSDISHYTNVLRLITSAKEVMFLPVFVCLFVCLSVSQQYNSKSYRQIFLKFWGYVGNSTNYQWFNFGHDPEGILDSGSFWNFRYHCVKGGIREPLAKRRWWRHLANNIALAEVPVGYDCVLVDGWVNVELLVSLDRSRSVGYVVVVQVIHCDTRLSAADGHWLLAYGLAGELSYHCHRYQACRTWQGTSICCNFLLFLEVHWIQIQIWLDIWWYLWIQPGSGFGWIPSLRIRFGFGSEVWILFRFEFLHWWITNSDLT